MSFEDAVSVLNLLPAISGGLQTDSAENMDAAQTSGNLESHIVPAEEPHDLYANEVTAVNRIDEDILLEINSRTDPYDINIKN
jgi:hypothetical protein